MHYSGQAGKARTTGIEGNEDGFAAFRDSVSIADVIATSEDVLRSARVPAPIRDETLLRLSRAKLSLSRQRLMFIYKNAFESMR